MRILAVDVGVGTQDILLYDDSKTPENCIKMVLPSMTRIIAERIRKSEGDVVLYGDTMGGGPLSGAVMEHIKEGYKVFMTEDSARSIRDNIEQVRGMGVRIIADSDIDKQEGRKIETMDIDFDFIKRVLNRFDEPFDFQHVGIAVQDHGHALNKPDRVFRFEKIREMLEKDARLSSLGFYSPPEHFIRMNAVLRKAKKFFSGKIIVVDTKIAAIAGAIHEAPEKLAIALDIGNGHTMGALVGEGYEVLGIFEHHTGMLTREKLEDLTAKFVEGKLTNEEVFNDGGHGCYIHKKIAMENVKDVVVTGPNRALLKNSKLNVKFATPFGDAMLAGPAGIVDIIKTKLS